MDGGVRIVKSEKSANAKRGAGTSSKTTSSTPKVGSRKADPPLLKAQKAAATREAVAVIQAFCVLPASEIEDLLDIGRPKPSKKGGKTGELLNSYLRASEDKDTAADETLARLMFSAVEHGLLDPQKIISMSMRPGSRRAMLPVRSLLLQLAIRSETKASKAEADNGYKKWCAAVTEHDTERRKERAKFATWKKKAARGLAHFLERMESMSHYSWFIEHKDSRTTYELDGLLTIISSLMSTQMVYALDARIDVTPKGPSPDLDAASSRQLLLDFADNLRSPSHDIGSLKVPTMTAEVQVNSGRALSSIEDFKERVHAIKSIIEGIRLDPRHEVDGDLPVVKDSPEDAAEVERQLSLYLDRPAVPAEEAEIWRVAGQNYQAQINAELSESMPWIAAVPALDRSSRIDPVLAFYESTPPDLPTITLAQAQEWVARIKADPDDLQALIPP